MDADGWRKLLVSKVYGECGQDLRSAFAVSIKKMCKDEITDNSLEAYLAYRLVPLDKKPGLRPIGVGEVLRRIAGKVVMSVIREDVKESCSEVQMCAGHEAGCEAAIDAMKEMYENEESEAVLLVVLLLNAFNSINRNAILHNIKIICPIMACYVTNCYRVHARLFIIGGKELKSREGTTQGDPLGMAVYAIGLTPLLEMMLKITNDNDKMVAFADDLTAVGKFESLRRWWDNLIELGPKFGYNPQPSKSWLIVKDAKIEEAKEHFRGTKIQITATGERHLGAVIGSEEFRTEYCQKLVKTWVEEINLLADIAVTEPQAAYTCYISGYQHRFTYFLRTIPGIEKHLQPVEEIIKHRLIPAITGGHLVNENERMLMSLPPKFGGLGIRIITEIAQQEYRNSKKMTNKVRNKILGEVFGEEVNEETKIKCQIRSDRMQTYKDQLEEIRSKMTETDKRRNEANQESGSYNWLTTLPLKEWGYDLNKERVLQVENGTFTPLVFSTHGGMGRECKKFYQRLTEMIAEKRDIPNSVATKYVRTRMSFSLLRSTLVCVRGSRSLKKGVDLNEVDMSLVNCVSEIKAI